MEILKKFGLDKSDTMSTPMLHMLKLNEDKYGTPIDATKYQSMIESLMYKTSSRPDITFATCMCAHYQSRPMKKHLTAMKQIFRYLKYTVHMGLWYPKDSSFELTAYSDADFAGCEIDRKSTSGNVHFVGDNLITWSSKKQNCRALSTAEAEYVSLSGCCAQVLWMKTQLTNYLSFSTKSQFIVIRKVP